MEKNQGSIVLTSTIWSKHPDYASVFYINDSGPNYSYGWGREQGYSVRAVSGDNTSNINPINKDDDEVGRYTLNGVMVNKPVKGINIIRTSNGKAKKVYVK